MKKTAVFIMVLALSLSGMFSASAAEATFKDTLEDNYPLVFDKSEWMRYEYNKDTDKTLYEKVSESGDVKTEEYVIYKMSGDITGFAVDCMHVNGLGDGKTDISVYLSKDNKKWVSAKAKVSEQTFDEEIYISKDTAYWMMSTVSNDGKCPAGYKYIKISINPFTVDSSCVWNTVMDTITVKYQGGSSATTTTTKKNDSTTKSTGSATGTTTASAETSLTDASGTTQTESTTAGTGVDTDTTASSSATTKAVGPTEDDGGSNMTGILIAAGIIVLLGGGAGAFFFIRRKKAI